MAVEVGAYVEVAVWRLRWQLKWELTRNLQCGGLGGMMIDKNITSAASKEKKICRPLKRE